MSVPPPVPVRAAPGGAPLPVVTPTTQLESALASLRITLTTSQSELYSWLIHAVFCIRGLSRTRDDMGTRCDRETQSDNVYGFNVNLNIYA